MTIHIISSTAWGSKYMYRVYHNVIYMYITESHTPSIIILDNMFQQSPHGTQNIFKSLKGTLGYLALDIQTRYICTYM